MAKRYNDLDNSYDIEDEPRAPDLARVPITGTNGAIIGYQDQSGTQATHTVTSDATESPLSPWSTPPPDGDWGAWFLRNIQSLPANPESLDQIEHLLKLQGISLVRNASGKAGKIKLPDGTVKDVGFAFSSGDPSQMKWQFIDAGSEAGAGDIDEWYSQNAPPIDPYTTPERPDYLRGEYKPPVWTGGDFIAPDANSMLQDPGYQARLKASQQAFERGAAAKGSILSGGSQIALGRKQGELASQEYANHFGRAFDTYRQKYGQFQDSLTASGAARGLNESQFGNDVTNSLNQYGTRYRTYRDAVDDQFRLSDLGLRATASGAPA